MRLLCKVRVRVGARVRIRVRVRVMVTCKHWRHWLVVSLWLCLRHGGDAVKGNAFGSIEAYFDVQQSLERHGGK